MITLGRFIKMLNQCGIRTGANSGSYAMTGTYAEIAAAIPSPTNYMLAYATDLGKSGLPIKGYNGVWVLGGGYYTQVYNNNAFLGYININPTGATYSQTLTTVTVTWASHGLTATLHNGKQVYLTQSTGSLLSGWFTNFTYVDANTFTCTSTVSQTTSGDLGANASETYAPDLMVTPDNLIRAGTVSGPTFLNFAKNNANGKTFRMYIGGVQITSTSITSGLSSVLSGTAWWSSGTEFYIQGSTTKNTAANKKWQGSITVASANDWAMLVPTFYNLMGG